nr:MAG TPA: hypothetical protein [Bacteriophage sp.]
MVVRRHYTGLDGTSLFSRLIRITVSSRFRYHATLIRGSHPTHLPFALVVALGSKVCIKLVVFIRE